MRTNVDCRFVAAVAVLTALVIGPAWSAATVVPMSLPELADRCEHAVSGTVVDVQSYWNADQTQIFTDIQIAVETDFKGNVGRDGVLTLIELGGTVGDDAMLVSDTPWFNVGEEVLIFTERLPDGRLIVLGRDLAKLTLVPAPGIALDAAGRVLEEQGPAQGSITYVEPGRNLIEEVQRLMVERGFAPVSSAEAATVVDAEDAQHVVPTPVATPVADGAPASAGQADGAAQTAGAPLGRVSVRDHRWEADGVFAEHQPEQELLQHRTRISKTFENPDGTLTAYFVGPVHYQDESGAWQDVTYDIRTNASGRKPEYEYANLTNDFHVYLPAHYSDLGVVIGREASGYVDLWQAPRMQLLSPGGELLSTHRPVAVRGAVSGRSITYQGTYPGISDEFKVLDAGVEHYLHLSSTAALGPLTEGKLVFTETVPLPEGYTVLVGGQPSRADFTSERFTIVAAQGETFTFGPIVAYDGRFDPQYLNIVTAPQLDVPPSKRGAAEEDLRQMKMRWGDAYRLAPYAVRFRDGSIEVSYAFDVEWLRASERVFPIVVDPEVTIGSNNGEFSSNACVYRTYYHDSRNQWVLLASNLTGAGMTAGTIDAYSVACYTRPASELVNLRWRFQNTSNTTSTAWLTSGYTLTWGPGNHWPTAGYWTNYTGMTGFTWNGSSNLMVDFSRDDSDYVTCSGSWYKWDAGTSRMCGGCADSLYSWPFDGMSITVFNHVPWTKITYTAARPCTSCTPADSNLGTIGTAVWGYSVSGNCGNGGKWVGQFSAEAGNVYHWDLCPDSPGNGSANGNFDADIKITNSGCTILSGVDGSCISGGNSYLPNDFQWTCTSAGTYYVIIAPYNSYASHTCNGTAGNTFTMYYYKAGSCSAPAAPASCSTSIGTPANGVQHHTNLSCATVSGAEGYDFDWSPDGSTWYNLAEDVYSAYDVNNGDSPNVAYYYRVRAYACSPRLYSSYVNASPYPIYTACDDPAAPTVSSPTTTTLNVTLNAESPVANPASTTYSIYCTTTSQYVQANGTLGATEVFQTRATWGTKTVTGLTCGTTYTFYAKAKNAQGDVRYNAANTASGTTSACAATITGVSPSSAPAGVGSAGPSGSVVTITGTNFGSPKLSTDHMVFWQNGTNYYYNDSWVTSWTNTQIQCYVPAGCSSKDCAVYKNGTWSNMYMFTVTFSFWYRWLDATVMPLTFYVNGTASGVGDPITPSRTSLQTWENVVNTYLDHSYRGTTTRDGSNHSDGYNDIAWRSGWPYDPGYIAQTTVSLSGGIIVETDIECNATNFTWSPSGEAGKMDIQNIVTHEGGHGFVGLSDLYGTPDTAKTMYGYSNTGETFKRDLDGTDVAGCQWIYPQTGAFANDACASAINIATLPTYVSRKNSSPYATDDYTGSTCDGPYKNLWWKVTGTGNQMIATTCSLNTNFDTEIAVYDACGGNQAGCNDDDNVYCTIVTNSSTVKWCSVAGQVYYISVGSYYSGGTTGSFEMQVLAGETTPATPTGATANPSSLCAGASTSLSCSAPGAGAVEWFTGGCGTTYVGTGNPLTVYPSSTTTYYARAKNTTSGCYSPGCASVGVTVLGTNDSCAGAIAVTPGTPVSGDTSTCATLDTAPVCNGYSPTAPGVWYKVTGTGHEMTASLCGGATWDTKLSVYKDGCGTLTCVTANDDSCGGALQSQVWWCSTNGSEYLILVHGFSTYTGPFTLTVTDNVAVPAPTYAYPDYSSFCQGQYSQITLYGGGNESGSTLAWYSGSCGGSYVGSGSPLAITAPTTTTTYYARWENSCGVSSCTSTTVTVNPAPSDPTGASANPASVCPGASTSLSCSAPGADVDWYTGGCGVTYVGTGNPLTVYPTGATTYYARARYASTGCVSSGCASVTIGVATLSTDPTGASATPSSICAGGSSTLSVQGGALGSGAAWQWYSGGCPGTSVGSGASVNVSPGSTTTYYVRAEGTCNTTTCASVTVTVLTNSTAPTGANASPSSICSGQSSTLSVSGGSLGSGAAWQWYSGGCPGTSVGSGASVNVSPGSTTTYYVRAEGTCNTTTCASVTVTVIPGPTAPTSASVDRDWFCPGDAGNISLSGIGGSGSELQWYTTACGSDYVGSGNPLTIASPAATTTYYARWANTCGASSCASVVAHVDTTGPTFGFIPGNVTVNADAGLCTASDVDIGQATATDDHNGVASIVATRSDSQPLSAPYPQGTTTITWTATDGCGNGTQNSAQTVTVQPYNTLLVDVQLRNVTVASVARCITFTLYDCSGSAKVVDALITFTNGYASGVALAVDCGDYDCIVAQDELHTLARRLNRNAGLNIDGSKRYVASFTTSSHDLIGGDLYDDNLVDIVDFGTYVVNWGATPGDPNCSTSPPHADLNGDHAVDVSDFNYISGNFLGIGEGSCCGGDMPGQPRTSITVAELRRLGLGRLVQADLNHDGVLDAQDVAAFLNGQLPEPMQQMTEDLVRDTADEGGGVR